MKGGKHLLLLAVFVLQARCQQKPQVSMSPALRQVFSGDILYLHCGGIANGSSVKWYFNDVVQSLTDNTWKLAVASPTHSGSYLCESNGQKSESFPIKVLEYIPSASLTIKTGHPVMETGGSVTLQLDNDDGLYGWNCWIYRGDSTKKIKLKWKDSVSLVFQHRYLNALETIFWCTNSTQQLRSNQIRVRTSEKKVSLEMYPLPAVVGESLILTCFTWGTNQISRAVFYKNNAVILDSASPTYNIQKVTESEEGIYKCDATFTYRDRTNGPPYKVVSDNQDVFVIAPPMKAVLSATNIGLSCSCPLCPNGANYHWYRKDDDGLPWERVESSQAFMMARESGTYACRAVWGNMKTLLSRAYVYHPPIKSILIAVVIGLLILGAAAVAFYIWYKKRNTTGPIYEDVAMRSRDKGDAEYDELHLEAAGRERKDGAYEALNKGEMKEGVYNTLGMEGAAGGAGGYEALKKEGMKEGVYHTLGTEGAGGGEGGYEAENMR